MAARDTSKPPSNLVAFPSLSSSLHSLPNATSLQSLSIHSTMYAHRAAESQAKLQKALSKTASSFTPNNTSSIYALPTPPQSQGGSEHLMMRPKKS